MKFGMPTLVECGDIYECCELAKRYGLDFVEINTSFPQYQPSRLDADLLIGITREKGISFTIHADEMLNPFDFNDKVSECYFGVMRDTIRFARKIGASIINIHLQSGVYVTLPDRKIFLNDVYADEYRKRVKAFIRMCEDEIGTEPIKITVENVDTNPFTESQLSVLPLFMNSPVFGLTLDTGHEYCLKFLDTPIFEQYDDKLVHLHLHDAREKNAHLPLGTGDVDVKAKLSQLSDGKTCLIEVKTVEGLIQSIEYLKNI